jgi:glyoxylase-like metal-dependent hydrolase (beta-lactamase superfamily II)
MAGAVDDVRMSEVADGCVAYLQRDGGWGWSNAGLVVGDGASLLVDTLFDLRITQRMLDRLADHTRSAPIDTVVNTHANGDHCFGNALVGDARIVASKATAEEMTEIPPSLLAGLNADPGPVGDLFRSFFGEFQFDGIDLRVPDRTFDGRLELDVGGRPVELIEVGPAHTRGDTIVHVPDAGVVFTGDILFIGGAPIVWAGPISNWIAACDLMASMDVDVVVPGHGPVTDRSGIAEVRDYLELVERESSERHAAGIDAFEAARDIGAMLGATERFGDLGEFGRIVANVEAVYRELDPDHQGPDVVELFGRMAAVERAVDDGGASSR